MTKRETTKRIRKELGLPCSECGAATRVKYSRRRPDGTFRFRTCPSCNRSFGSIERPVSEKSYTGVTLDDTAVRSLQIVIKNTPPATRSPV